MPSELSESRRQLASRRSKAAFERFRPLFDRSRDALLLFDDEGTIVRANPSAEILFGREAATLEGATLGSFDRRPVEVRYILAALKANEALLTETMIVRPDGTCRDVENLYAVSVVAGLHLCSVRDVTEYRSLERQLHRSQRMEGLGRLASGVAHDINNMLTVIRGYSEIMKRTLPAGSPLQRHADMIIAAADRSSNVTRQLVSFSRQQSEQLVPLDVRIVVTDVLKLLRNFLGEDIEITTSLADNTGILRADAAQIGQVVMNLAINARDAMPDGGELHVSTERLILDRSPEGAVRPIAPGEYVLLSMRDTGCGISGEMLPHIFKPFFTTKDRHKGTGLGLATVRNIVQRSGGTIVTRSKVGEGTTFEIYFPVERRAPSAASQ